ncbi:MAG: LLM class F420-dependent oxidoreductase [Candidatus Tectimicrobiota bacterium]|nr:MAG: LLM class F420-dependent oxidoreductase [Candidatus Tectomicrobia bacterium]
MGSIKMGIGLGLWQQGLPDAATLFEYIDKAEAWGLDSIWLSDHVLAPHPTLAIVPVMAAIAARTQRLKFGPSVMILPLRHPIAVAKEIATLDYLSGGRVIMAVGLGADEAEVAAFNVPLAQRAAMTDEAIVVLRKLWSQTHVSHHGRFYHFDDVTLTPRPTKKIDLWVGGRSDRALKRVAQLADGWFASFVTPEEFAAGMEKIAAYAAACGRADEEIEAGSIVFCHVDRDGERARRHVTAVFAGNRRRPPELVLPRSAVGTPEACREALQRYVEHGLTKFVLWPVCPPAQLITQLAYYAQEIIPYFEQRPAPATP